jgi:hypothetical protein
VSEKNINPLTENIGGGDDSQNRFEKVQIISRDSNLYSLNSCFKELEEKFDTGDYIFGTSDSFKITFEEEDYEPFHQSQFEWSDMADRYNNEFGYKRRTYKVLVISDFNSFDELRKSILAGKVILEFQTKERFDLNIGEMSLTRSQDSRNENYDEGPQDHSWLLTEAVNIKGTIFVPYQGEVI